MTRYVTYCRVSSEEQAEKDNSIPAQRKALRAFVASQPGAEIVAEFVDEGISAYAPAERRTGFLEMISFCRKNQIDAVLVHKLDRFSRNREESILFKGLLKKHNVAVKSASEAFDPESPSGFLYEGMIEVINQFYSMNLATEVLKGLKENASKGWVNGGVAPFGYRIAKVCDEGGREHGKYVPGDPEEVEAIRQIFQWSVEENMGAKTISNRLNARNIRGPGGGKWRTSSVSAILVNPVYVGDMVWGKTKKHGRTGRRVTNEDERIVVRNAHEALVPRELFERNRERALERDYKHRDSPTQHVNYLLGRLITCGHCGNRFIGRRREYVNKRGEKQTALAYYCSGYMFQGRSVCPSLPLDMAWLEGTVLAAIREIVCETTGWETVQRLVRARIDERRRKYGSDPKAAQRRLREIDAKIANYYRALGDGLDPTTCKQLIAQLEATRQEVEAEAERLQNEDYYAAALEKNLTRLERLRRAAGDDFHRLPFAVQRDLLTSFVSGLRVKDRSVLEVELKVAVDDDGIRHLADEIDAGEKVGWKGRNEEGPGKLPGPSEHKADFCQPGPRWCAIQDSNL